jgi:cysteine protease ATG4
VAVAIDSTLYQTHVFAASHGDMSVRSPRRRHDGNSTTTWGDRPVLLLLGIRLGIDGVNPIYYDTIKVIFYYLFTWTLIDSSSF